jgi:hypothetical protein
MAAVTTPVTAPVEEPVARRPFHRTVGVLVKASIVLCYVGVVVLRPSFPHNTAFVDPLLAVVSFIALLSMSRVGSPATKAAVKELPWIWVILLGSLLGLAGVGMAIWGVTDLAVSAFAFVTFFALWHLIYIERLERYAVWGTAIGLVITLVTISRGGAYRAWGLFAQPNYPAHYAVMACVVLVYASKHKVSKVLAIVAMVIIINRTGSFGSIAMTFAVLGVLAWRSMARHTAMLIIGMLVLLGGAIFYFSPASNNVSTKSFNFSSSLNSTRFDKSQSGRFQIWSDAFTAWREEPLGVGPAGVLNRNISIYAGTPLEVHDDALSFLVERGPIGLIGFIGFWFVLFRLSKKGGMARLLIIAVLVAGIFRETMHYRHMWLLLALCFVFDQRRSDERDALEEQASTPDGQPALQSSQTQG